MDYNYLKALHIIFMVAWFAGLFYLPRLLVYHTEANDKPEPDRSVLLQEYIKNEKLLFNAIMVPGMFLTLILGIWMIFLLPSWLEQSWMHLKLGFVVLLVAYQLHCRTIVIEVRKEKFRYTSLQLRLFNEIATIILFAVVFLVVLKNSIDFVYALIGLIIFAVIIMSAVRIVKKIREKQ